MFYFMLACLGAKDNLIVDTGQNDLLKVSPTASGPYNIGYASWEHVYIDAVGIERSIDINVWYPSDSVSGEDVVYMGFIEDELVLGGAPIAKPAFSNGHPLMVFSHGNFGYGANSVFLMRHFASHGWVAAAPDHTGNMVSDYSEYLPPNIRFWRPPDDTETINAIAGQDWLKEVNTKEVLLTGHSYGAYDGWLLAGGELNQNSVDEICSAGMGMTRPCSLEEREALRQDFLDDRIVGMVPMAGAQNFSWFGDSGRSDIGIPILQLSGTEDEDEPLRIWENRGTTNLRWLELVGGCHQAFALGACTQMSNEEAFGITQSYTLAFGREIVLGDSAMSTVLDGSEDLGWSDLLLFHTP